MGNAFVLEISDASGQTKNTLDNVQQDRKEQDGEKQSLTHSAPCCKGVTPLQVSSATSDSSQASRICCLG